jgi:hypothetical protein
MMEDPIEKLRKLDKLAEDSQTIAKWEHKVENAMAIKKEQRLL